MASGVKFPSYTTAEFTTSTSFRTVSQDEDEFLMSLNRFNVMTSRARAKLITLVTQEVVNHLSGELDILRQSRLLKVYVESFCNNFRPMTLGYVTANGVLQVDGIFKWRQ